MIVQLPMLQSWFTVFGLEYVHNYATKTSGHIWGALPTHIENMDWGTFEFQQDSLLCLKGRHPKSGVS